MEPAGESACIIDYLHTETLLKHNFRQLSSVTSVIHPGHDPESLVLRNWAASWNWIDGSLFVQFLVDEAIPDQ